MLTFNAARFCLITTFVVPTKPSDKNENSINLSNSTIDPVLQLCCVPGCCSETMGTHRAHKTSETPRMPNALQDFDLGFRVFAPQAAAP